MLGQYRTDIFKNLPHLGFKIKGLVTSAGIQLQARHIQCRSFGIRLAGANAREVNPRPDFTGMRVETHRSWGLAGGEHCGHGLKSY